MVSPIPAPPGQLQFQDAAWRATVRGALPGARKFRLSRKRKRIEECHLLPDHVVSGLQVPPKTSGNGRMSAGARAASSIVLPIEQSAALRDRLISEIAELQSQDSAATWAREALPLKNTLTAADARLVETAFALKQSAFSLSDAAEPSRPDLLQTTAAADTTAGAVPSSCCRPSREDQQRGCT